MKQEEWIELVDRLDHLMHRHGIPSSVRGQAIAEITTIMAQASKHTQDRRQLVLAAVAEHGNVRKAAKAEGWSHETFYAELRRRLSNHPVTV